MPGGTGPKFPASMDTNKLHKGFQWDISGLLGGVDLLFIYQIQDPYGPFLAVREHDSRVDHGARTRSPEGLEK